MIKNPKAPGATRAIDGAKGPSEFTAGQAASGATKQSACRYNEEPGTTTTGHVEIDSNITRPRTQEDVVREILSSQPSEQT
jgi:hypothetical protein